MALKEIDKDFYAQHRSGLTRYCLEVYGRIDNYLRNTGDRGTKISVDAKQTSSSRIIVVMLVLRG